LNFAFFLGSPAKALIYKALARPTARYQQSYPQKIGVSNKNLINQTVRSDFATKHQLHAASEFLQK
jgi:hypothetical protein